MQITSGKNKRAQKIVIYGVEGIGKSTLASKFPQALFSDVEGSTDELDVQRLPRPTSWEMLLQQGRYLKSNPFLCRTWVIDTADWAEKLCSSHICTKAHKNGLADFGYGNGYVYLEEEFGRFLNLCSELIDLGINIVFTAHAQIKRFEQPDEMGAYDRWELKLEKKTAPLLKEWADMVLFANYKTYVVKTDDKKSKVQGGKRVMYTAHHSCWDAKNRHGLPEEIPFEFSSIAHGISIIGSTAPATITPVPVDPPKVEAAKVDTHADCNNHVKDSVLSVGKCEKGNGANGFVDSKEKPCDGFEKAEQPQIQESILDGITKPLADLMRTNNVTPAEIQKAVSQKGYYPVDTPISNYDPQFVNGVLIAAWQQVYKLIEQIRETPF
jgi:GTPase SAR1 family protein